LQKRQFAHALKNCIMNHDNITRGHSLKLVNSRC